MMVTTEVEGAIRAVPTPDAGPNAESGAAKRHGDNRRSNKPIMEKRRRARINNCLNELKTLILDAMKKDPARHSKLEKADILEMTVKHLQNLQRQQAAAAPTDASVLHRYRAGFSECATEVGRFPGLEPAARRRLLQHLAGCLSRSAAAASVVERQVQVRVQPQGIVLGDGAAGVQLLPTRLPNGDIALVLPGANVHQQHQGVPLLVPIVPERTSSTGSATSSSNYSPSHSPEPAGYGQSKPLSLVVRKPTEPTEEKPWRPW